MPEDPSPTLPPLPPQLPTPLPFQPTPSPQSPEVQQAVHKSYEFPLLVIGTALLLLITGGIAVMGNQYFARSSSQQRKDLLTFQEAQNATAISDSLPAPQADDGIVPSNTLPSPSSKPSLFSFGKSSTPSPIPHPTASTSPSSPTPPNSATVISTPTPTPSSAPTPTPTSTPTPTATPSAAECQDSDNGRIYETKGTTSGGSGKTCLKDNCSTYCPGDTCTDMCIADDGESISSSGRNVLEWFCSDGKISYELRPCVYWNGTTCNAGACK